MSEEQWRAFYDEAVKLLREELVKGNFCVDSNSKLLERVLERVPRPRIPLARENVETQKSLAKIAFRDLPKPVQNLVLGLTDLEKKLSRLTTLRHEARMRALFEVFHAYVDALLVQCRFAYDKCFQLYTESETRFVKEWTRLASEEDLAMFAHAVVRLTTALDAHAHSVLDDTTYELYLSIRASMHVDDGPIDPDADGAKAPNAYVLYQKSLDAYRTAKEAYEFLKRRAFAKESLAHVDQSVSLLQETARQGAQARFGLHKVHMDRLSSDRLSGDDLESLLRDIEERKTSQSITLKVLQDLGSQEEPARAGPSRVDTTEIASACEACETRAATLRKLEMQTRVETSMAYRKHQDRVWDLVKDRLAPASLRFATATTDADDETLRLHRAKKLMVAELHELQATFRFRMSDIDVIFQSVQAGIAVSEDTAGLETARGLQTSIERSVRQVIEWQSRMAAVLV